MKVHINKTQEVEIFPITDPKPKVDKNHTVMIVLVEKLTMPPEVIKVHPFIDPYTCVMMQYSPEGWMWIQPKKEATDRLSNFFAKREKTKPGTMLGKWHWLVDVIEWKDDEESKQIMEELQNANSKGH